MTIVQMTITDREGRKSRHPIHLQGLMDLPTVMKVAVKFILACGIRQYPQIMFHTLIQMKKRKKTWNMMYVIHPFALV